MLARLLALNHERYAEEAGRRHEKKKIKAIRQEIEGDPKTKGAIRLTWQAGPICNTASGYRFE